jgi:hypothetical protein
LPRARCVVKAGATNAPSTANAGQDVTAAIPEPGQLVGMASDPNGATFTSTWSSVSGPETVTFSAANASTTSATFSAPGDYALRLSVSDGTNTVTDTVIVSIPALYPTPAWATATPAHVKLAVAKLDQAKVVATAKPRNFGNGVSDEGGSGMRIRYDKLADAWGNRTVRYDVKSTTQSIGGIALLLAFADPGFGAHARYPGGALS